MSVEESESEEGSIYVRENSFYDIWFNSAYEIVAYESFEQKCLNEFCNIGVHLPAPHQIPRQIGGHWVKKKNG